MVDYDLSLTVETIIVTNGGNRPARTISIAGQWFTVDVPPRCERRFRLYRMWDGTTWLVADEDAR